MPYSAEISRSNPTAFLFLVDQSGSMADILSTEKPKSLQVADVLNRTLASLITRCTKAEGTRNYFEIGVLGYGGTGILDGFQGEKNSGGIIRSIASIEASPLRIEERKKKMDDGAGGIVEQTVKFPIWFEPIASGGTPMCEAIIKAAGELVTWCDAHPNSYPPTVLHITDGESTDGDPEELCNQLRQIQTNDGNVLLFNLHLSSNSEKPIEFPSSENSLPDNFARLLFRMSSLLPEHLVSIAREKSFNVGAESRGFMFNGDAVQIVEFFDIGTRASQLR